MLTMDENVEITVYILISSLLMAASHNSTLKRKGALSSFCCFWFIQVALFGFLALWVVISNMPCHWAWNKLPLAFSGCTVPVAGKEIQILPCPENPPQILELGLCGCFLIHKMTRFMTWAYLWGLAGALFSILRSAMEQSFATAVGYVAGAVWAGLVLGRSRSCWNHSPRHCFHGLGTPRRALKSRSDGKGQQALSISKAWAKAQPFIH